jgi:hypothetical protein
MNCRRNIRIYVRLAKIAQPLAEGATFQMVQAATVETVPRKTQNTGPTRILRRDGKV